MSGCKYKECCSGSNEKPSSIIIPGTDDHNTPWKFYNHLIAGIPEGIQVKDYCFGSHWSYLDSECGMGVSFSTTGGARTRNYTSDLRGLELRDVAQLSKSWNFQEATIGISALNAWYNQPDKIEELGAVYDKRGIDKASGKVNKSDIFEVYRDRVQGKKVVIVGHFPHVDRVAEIADTIVLERNCGDALDTPDPACEYVVPSADFFFMTGVTLINKTAPRLLTLAKNAMTILTGPSAIASPFLYKWGVDVIAGSVVEDPEKTCVMVKQGCGMLFDGGIKMFRLEKKE